MEGGPRPRLAREKVRLCGGSSSSSVDSGSRSSELSSDAAAASGAEVTGEAARTATSSSCGDTAGSGLELQTKVHTKVTNHGEGPY